LLNIFCFIYAIATKPILIVDSARWELNYLFILP